MAKSNDRQRYLVADEAARLVLEEGLGDYGLARDKAARRFGVQGRASLPTLAEVDVAVVSRRGLFGLKVSEEQVSSLQRVAVKVMQAFSGYAPRLVGELLEGLVTPSTAVEVHLLADSTKLLAIELLNQGVAYQSVEHLFSGAGDVTPGFVYEVTGVPVYLFVFATHVERDALRDERNGSRMKGASLKQMKEMMLR